MIPPTGVTGSFLTGVLFEHDGKPIEKAQVTISSNGYQFETKLKGEFKIPVSKVDTVVLPLKINSGSRTVVTDLGLPADMIAPVALARVNAGLPVPVGATLPSSSGSAAGNPDASLQSRTLGMQLPANSAPADVKQPTVVYSIPVQTASSAKSVGAFNKSGILISNTSVRLNWDNMFAEAAQINIVFARTAAELSGWDGRTESIPAWPDAPPGGTIISDYSKCSDAQFRSFDNGSLTALNDAKCGFVREAFPFNLNSDVFVRVVGESASELKLSAVFKVSPVEISKPVLSIATISPQSIPENSAPLELSVAVNEAGTNLACASVLTVQSSNQTLLPNQNISLTGTAPSCKITLTPALKKSGTSEVTLVADNGFMSASSAFLLTVTGTQPAGPRPQPVLTVLNAAADKLINEAEKSLQTQVVELSGGPFTTQGFAIVSEVTVCDAAVIYTAAVPTAARTAVGQMSKKICVRTEDSEGNVSFAQSEVVAVEPTTFTSLVWANGAADGFINAADAAANLPIATLSATGYITANYTLVSTSTLCNGSITYNKASVPTSNDASLVDGNSYKLCVKLADGAGNVTYGASASQISVDKTAPNLTITTPLAGSSVSSLFNVQGTCEVGLSVIASVVDGGTTSSITCSGSNTYLIPLSLTGSDGSKTISVSATDGANQTTLKTVSVVKDATSPTVTISAPSVAQVNQSGRLTYSVSFSDLNGIQVASLDKSKITLTATGSALCSVSSIDGAGTTADPFIVTISNCANDGTVGISVASSAATDLAGNSSQLTTSATSVIVDNTAPTPTITSPAADTVFNSATVNTALTGDCENGRTVTLGGDVTAGQTTSCTGTPGAYSFSSWTLTNGAGTKSVTVSQTDAAGNTGTSLARSFTLSFPPSAPTLTASNVSGLKGVLAGTCDSAATSHTATTTLGVVRNVQCTDGTLTVFVHLPEGSSSFSVTATSTNAVGSASSSPVVFTRTPFFCPVGYVGVPGKFATDSDTAGLGNVNASANNSNAGLDPTRDFCVMKYPAKVATSNSGGQQSWEPVYDGNKIFTMANYWPESRADSTPWVNISRDNSIDRCKALNEAYGHCSGAGCYSTFDNTTWGYRLMSNTQWQVIARNLESTGANWTSGTVGTGFLWRGHSDNTITSATTNLLTQTYNGATQLSLSNPKSDAGNSDYFGTGNNLSQNTNGTAGWQERRRFVLSNGTSVWDMAGNVWQWVSDDRSALGIPAADDTAGMSTNGWYSYLNGSSNRFSATGNLIFGNLGSGGLQFSEGKNAGQLYGGSAGAVLRGGYWSHTSSGGLFAAYLRSAPTSTGNGIGFRCVFLPPPLTGPLDTGAPTVAVQRVDAGGVAVANNSVTVSAGGFWNLGISVSDAENTGTRANLIRVKVRRKIATSSTDFPSATDPIYKSGFNLSSLPFETAWELNSTTNQYTRNDGTYVNYLVTAIDPAGNTGSATFSVQNTKSCPPGYVGVPGNGTAGLGNANATVGNANASLDPSREFCVMKYPAKVMSAGTTAAQSTVGGLFEPIMNGNATFANTYTYTDAATFASGITYLPESRSSGTPWVNISRDNSINACRAQQMQYLGSMPDTTTGTGFQLMSNTQWQVVARNAEAQAVNWSNNAVGNGVLNRGHSDNVISATEVTNSWCFGCTAPSTSLSGAPNSVSDVNYYFATGNTATKAWNAQGTSIEASSEQKRTHTLSNGAVTWDMAGNVWQWVSDNNASTRTSDDMGVSDTVRGWAAWKEYSDAGLTASDKLIFSGAGNYTSSKNAGQIYGASAGAVRRGGAWNGTSYDGLFAAYLRDAPTFAYYDFGFRCVFLPPPLTGPLDTGAPTVAVQRVNGSGGATANTAVTISAGGFWNLGFTISDAENTGTNANRIWVQVRRKIATSNTDFPSTTDTVYKAGYNLTLLSNETAWELNSTTNQYVRNDGTYVNYLVTAIDPAGNTGSATISIENTQSCPPGYVGVPGNNTPGLGSNGDGTANLSTGYAQTGHSNASLDPSREFCVMKYPAKVMSAGTTAAQSTVGGLFEPIMNGNATFANTYTYTDASTFASGITYLPESRSSGTPWVNINRNDAISACRAQQMQYLGSMPDTTTGTGFQLMSNTQWQVVARNAEAQAVNWSNNAVGNGVLNRGHSDNGANDTNVTNNSWSFTSPGSLANSISDLNSYFATGNTATKAWNAQGTSIEASSEQKRTHTLSNGAVTWDMAGNVWQWVSDDRSALGIPAADNTAGMSTNGWRSYLNGSTNRFSSTGNLIFGNLGSGGLQFSEGKNAGQLHGGSAGGVLRGGHWSNSSYDGLFAASLLNAPTYTSRNFGFRCVFLP